MGRRRRRAAWLAGAVLLSLRAAGVGRAQPDDLATLGRELAVPRHLQDGEEYQLPLLKLLAHGRKLFTAVWTPQDGGGRPLAKGTGAPLVDATAPLVFPRNFNRLSGPDANACAGCHNLPFGRAGGGGDIAANVFVLAQRFDFVTFDAQDPTRTRGAVDERGQPVTLQSLAGSRATLGMYGAGFIEMLARQMTADLQALRDAIPPGESKPLVTKGVAFGTLARRADGSWDTARVEGLAAPSLVSGGAAHPPSLLIRPFHQDGRVVSLRDFTVTAFHHHHGIQATERFGIGTDPDGDGVVNELTRADVTAAVLFQATLPVPGRRLPRRPALVAAVRAGEARFQAIGCAACHVPSLPLDRNGWIFTEPGPFNPPGTLRPGEAPTLSVDLTHADLPPPRLPRRGGVVHVPAYTDLKLHDITCGPDDPNREPLDLHRPPGAPAFFAGTGRFLTKKLWGFANEPPFFHHGQFTTIREAILAHCGEARASREAFEALTAYEQATLIEFLKTLQVLPPGTRPLVVRGAGADEGE